MKKILKSSIGCLIFILLTSCSAKKEELVLKSPEGNIELSFKANRPSSLDPWAITMNIKGYEKDKSISLKTSRKYNQPNWS